jgi:hypothetical protein
MAVKIVPSEDEAYTVMSAGEHVWRKKYPSTSAATSEAVTTDSSVQGGSIGDGGCHLSDRPPSKP